MKAQEFYRILNSAFSDFFVADMNGRRCETYGLPTDEAEWYAQRGGARMGTITAAVCKNASLVKVALDIYKADGLEGFVLTDEGETLVKSQILPYLVTKYQHDENRPQIIEVFVTSCVNTMREALKDL